MYRVVFTQRALKDLKNVDKKMQNRIAMKLKEYAKEPLNICSKINKP